jgi:hypothetical protein
LKSTRGGQRLEIAVDEIGLLGDRFIARLQGTGFIQEGPGDRKRSFRVFLVDDDRFGFFKITVDQAGPDRVLGPVPDLLYIFVLWSQREGAPEQFIGHGQFRQLGTRVFQDLERGVDVAVEKPVLDVVCFIGRVRDPDVLIPLYGCGPVCVVVSVIGQFQDFLECQGRLAVSVSALGQADNDSASEGLDTPTMSPRVA